MVKLFRCGLIYSFLFHTRNREGIEDFRVSFQWEIVPFTVTSIQFYNKFFLETMVELIKPWIIDQAWEVSSDRSQSEFGIFITDPSNWLWGIQVFNKIAKVKEIRPDVLFRIIDTQKDKVWVKEYGSRYMTWLINRGREILEE